MQRFRDERGRCDRHYRTVAETAVQNMESERARIEDEEKQRTLREEKRSTKRRREHLTARPRRVQQRGMSCTLLTIFP